jgi:hypothetical protein
MGSKENTLDVPMGKVAAMTTLKTMSQGKTIKKRSATPSEGSHTWRRLETVRQGKTIKNRSATPSEGSHTWRHMNITSTSSSAHGMKAMEPKPESPIGKAMTNISAKILITFIPQQRKGNCYAEKRQKLSILFYVHD